MSDLLQSMLGADALKDFRLAGVDKASPFLGIWIDVH